jgi:UDP-N-acetylglucosamine:LPS N-acetylglucosamine transferase
MEIHDRLPQPGALTMTPPRAKVLILTAHTGGGHISLAQAMKDTLDENYAVEIAAPLPSIIHRYYTWAERHSLRFYELTFNSSDNEKAALRMHKIVTSLIQKRLKTLIEQVEPQLIISAHPFLYYSVARVNEQLSKRIPLVFLLPEPERIHSAWIAEKNADAYLVSDREVFDQALASGIDESRLYLTGRPVRKQFLQDYRASRSATLAAFDFDPALFTVFLQGGAEGTFGMDRTVQSILASNRPMQIILAVGTNKRLASRYAAVSNLRVLPFVETIAPYMAAADLVIGKAGPTFIYEAVMLEKPFLATFYIPGQETVNLAFLERHNLGWVCLEGEAQKQLITRLAADPALLTEKVNSIRAFRAWNIQANQTMYPLIESLVQTLL